MIVEPSKQPGAGYARGMGFSGVFLLLVLVAGLAVVGLIVAMILSGREKDRESGS